MIDLGQGWFRESRRTTGPGVVRGHAYWKKACLQWGLAWANSWGRDETNNVTAIVDRGH